MAKIDRFNGNLKAFASESLGTERTVFGDVTQSDLLDDNITSDFLRGWGIVGVNDAPTKQDFNGLAFTLGQLLSYLHQTGVPEWNALQIYQIDSFANRSGVLYVCLTADHVSATAPESDATNWRLIRASDIFYDNAASGLIAETPQAAFDEIMTDAITFFGIKTFDESPIAPTPAISDVSQKLATTEFVSQLVVGDSVTGTATFTNSTNNINLAGIGLLAGVEVGDVYRVTDSLSNNTEFTVEVITDDDNIIVNQAHAGGTTTKSIVDETSTAGVTVQLLVKWYEAGFGVGQGWVDVAADRTANVTETNTTGRPFQVVVSTPDRSAGGNLSVDGVITGQDNPEPSVAMINTATVPAGSTYVYSNSFTRWTELR